MSVGGRIGGDYNMLVLEGGREARECVVRRLVVDIMDVGWELIASSENSNGIMKLMGAVSGMWLERGASVGESAEDHRRERVGADHGYIEDMRGHYISYGALFMTLVRILGQNDLPFVANRKLLYLWAAFRPDKVQRLSPVRDMDEVSESTIALAFYILSLTSVLGPLVHDGRLCLKSTCLKN